jgi:hypothetical protein
MKISQQIVGVNQRLGNTAVPNMQGTTRIIYDSIAPAAVTNQTLTFFAGVSSRPYPQSNINTNKFEVGESLAIQTISWGRQSAAALANTTLINANIGAANNFTQTLIFNLYIGNQRVVKDLDLNYARFGIGESYNSASIKNCLHFETPIVIPPQIEFYATLSMQLSGAATVNERIYLALGGLGTLLNTKSNF